MGRKPKAPLRKNRSRELTDRELDDASAGTAATGPSPVSSEPLGGDDSFSVFMKLQFTDPNNSVSTHESLHEIQKGLRKKRP